jgi:hypothetical protein
VSSGDTLSVFNDARVLFRGAGPLTESEGVDENRIELRVDGHLKMANDTGLASRGKWGSSRDTDLRIGSYVDSSSVAVGLADWYGIRLPSADSLTIDKGADIGNARAAIAMESSVFPDLSALAVPGIEPAGPLDLSLKENRTMISFDRDVLIGSAQTVTIPRKWTIGFAAERDEANIGSDSSRVELIVEGTLTADAFHGSEIVFRSDDDNPTYDAQWGGITFDLRVNPIVS